MLKRTGVIENSKLFVLGLRRYFSLSYDFNRSVCFNNETSSIDV